MPFCASEGWASSLRQGKNFHLGESNLLHFNHISRDAFFLGEPSSIFEQDQCQPCGVVYWELGTAKGVTWLRGKTVDCQPDRHDLFLICSNPGRTLSLQTRMPKAQRPPQSLWSHHVTVLRLRAWGKPSHHLTNYFLQGTNFKQIKKSLLPSWDFKLKLLTMNTPFLCCFLLCFKLSSIEMGQKQEKHSCID